MMNNIRWFSISLVAIFYVWCVLNPMVFIAVKFNIDKLTLWVTERTYNFACRMYNIMVKRNYGAYSTRQEICEQIKLFNNIIYDYKIDF